MVFYKEYYEEPTKEKVEAELNEAIKGKNLALNGEITIDKLNASSNDIDKHVPSELQFGYIVHSKWFAKAELIEC